MANIGSDPGVGGRLADRKSKAAGRRRARRDLAEKFFTNIQGDAAIATPVCVTAFKTPAIVSEQQCAGIEQPVADVRAIGEASFDDGRDAESVVPLLEGPIRRSGATDDFMHAPAVSGRQRSLGKALVRRLGRGAAPRIEPRFASQRRIAIFPKPRNAARA